MLRAAAAFLLPRGCLACRVWVAEPTGTSLLCAPCRTRLRTAPWPRCPRCHHPSGTGREGTAECIECAAWPDAIGRARHAFVLEPPASEMAHALKYEGWSAAAREMARAMADIAGELVEGPDTPDAGDGPIVVPVPTTRARARSRGYNQAELLARGIAELRGLRCEELLERPESARSQTGLDPDRRRENVRDAFRVVRGAELPPRTPVLLVDDVLTTGATVGVAAKVLVGAGASRVDVVTYARALPRRRRGRARAA